MSESKWVPAQFTAGEAISAGDHVAVDIHSGLLIRSGTRVEPETVPDPKGDTHSMKVDLHKDGILWAINRQVFHPRGMALACTSQGEFFIQGNGTELWTFDEATDDEKFEDFKAVLKRVEEHNRS